MSDLVRILEGNAFVVSDDRGDIEESPTYPTGLFSFDTRFLSTWQLSVNGERLRALSVDETQYFEVVFFLAPGARTRLVDAKATVIRRRWVGGSFHEELTILNHNKEAVDLTVRIDAGSDFADLLEIGDVRLKKGTTSARVQDGRLRLTYEREGFLRETIVSSTVPAEVDQHGLNFTVHIDPNGSWGTELTVATVGAREQDIRTALHRQPARTRSEMREDLDQWMRSAPILDTDWKPLADAYQRSLVDLAALRFPPLVVGRYSVPAAGLPWYMTTFGRHSIFACLQSLPFVPGLAATTLRVLSDAQGSRLDDFREEEPGKIPHELRYGESAAFEEQPHTPYYGTADATALWVVLLDEYERWTGDVDLVRRFERRARAALTWIDEYGDLLGNGYVSYRRRNEQTGLVNQGWKDSQDAISYHDGRMPDFPLATCELQGYAYDAKVRGARLAREFWNDPAYADKLERDAADLKQRFNRDYWIEDGGYYALAVDPVGARVDALSSNIGHLLWSGIVEDSRAKRIAEHLLGPRLFSGWGVRTLAEGEALYNPVGYHVGTVWPFDNSIIAWGLCRYHLEEEAGVIAAGIISAAEYFDGRLPEAFGGYHRRLTDYPVEYPTACSPQAWSAGATLLLIRTMLGMEPQGEYLAVDPALPHEVERVKLLDVPGRWGRADAFGRRRPDG